MDGLESGAITALSREPSLSVTVTTGLLFVSLALSLLAFSLAGILGASLAPYIATWLATNWGLQYVGYYLSASAVLTFLGLLSIRETKDDDLTAEESPARSPRTADSTRPVGTTQRVSVR